MNKKIICIGIVSMFLLTGLSLTAVGIELGAGIKITATGDTIYVDDDNIEGPWDGTLAHPYKNVQDGIENSNNGDTVFVFKGEYSYNLLLQYFGKSIKLKGEEKNLTILKLDLLAFNDADNIEISNFTWINSHDISLFNCNYCLIENNNMGSISLTNSNNCIIQNNQIKKIELRCKSNYNQIIGNINSGIQIGGESEHNKVIKNTNIRCIIHNSNNNIVEYNSIDTNSIPASGIEIGWSKFVSVRNNEVNNIQTTAIRCHHSNDSIIENNNIITNKQGDYGIIIYFSENILAKNNNINNYFNGIDLFSNNNITIDSNSLENIQNSVISLTETVNSKIIENIFKDKNPEADIYFFHLNDENEVFIPGKIPNSYEKVRAERDLSNNWSHNYWGEKLSGPKEIKGILEFWSRDGDFIRSFVKIYNYDHNPHGKSKIKSFFPLFFRTQKILDKFDWPFPMLRLLLKL